MVVKENVESIHLFSHILSSCPNIHPSLAHKESTEREENETSARPIARMRAFFISDGERVANCHPPRHPPTPPRFLSPSALPVALELFVSSGFCPSLSSLFQTCRSQFLIFFSPLLSLTGLCVCSFGFRSFPLGWPSRTVIYPSFSTKSRRKTDGRRLLLPSPFQEARTPSGLLPV